MRLTRAGVGVALAGVICFIIGRLFGTMEMYLLAAMCVIALMLAAAFTATAALDLAIGRSATPSKLRAGTAARIDLVLRNKSKRRTPVLRVDDQVGNSRGASLLLAPIEPGDKAEIAYRLPTRRRGELTVGPLDLTLGDPLGLTRSLSRASDRVRLVVHPELYDLGVLHATAGHDPTADLQPVRALANDGDEFFALRPYVVGDELKRVHWKASARTDDLIVRQVERPRTGRVTIVLDRRRDVFDEDGFDRACSAAISTLTAAWRGDDALRFLTTAPGSVSDVRSRQELNAIDEQLAMLETTDNASLIRTIDEISRVGRGGTLVVITGAPSQELSGAVEQSRRKFGVVLPILCQPPSEEPQPGFIAYDGTDDFAAGWRRAATATGAGR
jgi:uncharacterized protein (DUF58 family)